MVWQRQLVWRRPRRPKGARHAKKHSPGRHACGRGKGALHMKIIIAGDGKVGLALTRQLLHEGHELVVIDSNRSVLGRSLEKYDLLTVPGNAAALGTLREAGAADADLLIAATSTDETNILCCLVAKRLNPRLHTIARVRSYEYAEQLFLMREELGLSMSVNPELAAASEIFRLLQFPSFIQRETFAKGRVEIVELRVDEGSRLCGVPLSQLDSITRVKVLVCAVTHGGAVTIPNGNYVLAAGDHIHVTAAGADLARLLKNLGIMRRRVRQVMLVGGGRITYYLAKRLLQSGVGVKIIEIDAKRAVQLAEALPAAEVALGDGSSRELLLAEGLTQADALVTLTGIDEENIVVSMFGHSQNVPKIVTKINRLEYGSIFAELGVGSIVSPKELCSNDIARYVRAMQNTVGSVLTLHSIAGGEAEALEFRVDGAVHYCGVPLRDVPLRAGVLIACITRRGKTIIPDGAAHFEKGDTVVAVTACEEAVTHMNDLFEP